MIDKTYGWVVAFTINYLLVVGMVLTMLILTVMGNDGNETRMEVQADAIDIEFPTVCTACSPINVSFDGNRIHLRLCDADNAIYETTYQR